MKDTLIKISEQMSSLRPQIEEQNYHVQRQYERCMDELRELQLLVETA